MSIKARIYRGEVRTALPTHTHPDPAEHLAQDPHDFLRTWMQPHYPFPKQYRGEGELTVGEHWTRSPEIIPERFALEGFHRTPQTGVPMGKREATAVSRREWVDLEHLHEPVMPAMRENEGFEEREQRWSQHHAAVASHRATIDRYEKYLGKAEKEGVNSFQDLSHPSARPDAAKPFRMGIVWEAEHPHEHEFEPGTNYEDELNLRKGVAARVTGARMWIPKSGTTLDPRGQHPSVFTPEEHLAASLDAHHRSTYSAIAPKSSVPWNRIQFPEPVSVPVGARKHWNR